jgi:hypothetical protein
MSQPVKLSDALVLDARIISELAERSIAGQIEYWARLGKAIEPLLSGERTLALRKSGEAKLLSTLIAEIESSEGQRRVADYLVTQPFPHYEPADGKPGYLVRIESNGTRTTGKFVNREFQPLVNMKAPARRKTTKKP